MHPPIYLAICAASLSGMLIFGTPDLASMVFIAALAIAVLGVPHGGLDHWTGRRLLERHFANWWWIVFFPAYLSIGLAFAVGWYLTPTVTVTTFFLISAWHFGREDQHANGQHLGDSRSRQLWNQFTAAAVGGLVIWVPAIGRPDEMWSLLRLIIPAVHFDSAGAIVEMTQAIALCLIPIASLTVITQIITSPRDFRCWVPVATTAIAIYTPILASFSIYFCGWHSWQGLQRLRREEALPASKFVRCIFPLSSVTVLGVAAVGWWIQDGVAGYLVNGETSATLQAVFIGLSAIAVPHLFLHEFESLLKSSRSTLKVCS